MESPSPSRPSQTRSWSDLPRDILSQIADRLEIMELLNFRGTCRDFHWASSSASAIIESMPGRKPWLLMFGENKKCRLYNQTDQEKRYTGEIPELEGATCLASYEGWLLLFKEESIFLFCPFSSAKIPLPSFPHSDVKDHVATLSSPPSSEECFISVINRHNKTTLELNVIQRGDVTWTKHEFHCRPDFGKVTGATYDNGKFYYVDDVKSLITFDLEDSRWTSYWIVQPTASDPKCSTMPFSAGRYYVTDQKKMSTPWDDFETDVSVSVSGTLVRKSGVTYKHLIHNEQLDIRSNCSESEGNSEKRRLQGVWIQPRFFQPSAEQSWLM